MAIPSTLKRNRVDSEDLYWGLESDEEDRSAEGIGGFRGEFRGFLRVARDQLPRSIIRVKEAPKILNPMDNLQLPRGFRFHPTDEELVLHYLYPKVEAEPSSMNIITDLDIYKFDPWNLPEQAAHGENEWYFFSPRDRKYPNGSRPNRAAGSGYWKATGTDKVISCAVEDAPVGSQQSKKLGVKKALVFYKGRAPKGAKTNWIMHEYRIADNARRRPRALNSSTSSSTRQGQQQPGSLRLDDWVLCRIYKKKGKSNSSSVPQANMPSSSSKHPELPDDFAFQQNVSMVEEFLASLPEIDASKINHLYMLPKLEDK